MKTNYSHSYLHCLVSLLLILTLFLAGCSHPPAGRSYQSYQHENSQEDSPQDFDNYSTKLFAETIAQNTLDLHYTLEEPEKYGIQNYPITLGTISKENIDDNATQAKKTLQELEDLFSYEQLNKSQQRDYDVLTATLELAVQAADFPYYQEFLTTVIGMQSQLPILLSEYRLETTKDVEDYLLLLQQLPDYFQQLLAYEQKKSEQGRFMCDYVAEAVIKECEDFIQDPESNYLIGTFNDKIDELKETMEDTLPDQQWNQWKESNQQAVLNQVIPAYEALIQGLKNLLGTGSNDAGLCKYPDGKAYYEYLVRSCTGSDHSISELESMAKNQMLSDLTAMQLLLKEDNSLYAQLDGFSFSKTEPLEILRDLSGKIDQDFPTLKTAAKYTVKYVDSSLEDNLSPAFYLTPQMDRLDSNVIYINGKYLKDTTSLYPTLAHEGYPGHLFQTVYTAEQVTNPIRNLCSYTGYSEGWATYVEYYSYTMDENVDSKLASLLQHNSAASLGIYALLDMYINYDGWTMEDAAEFLENYYSITDKDTLEEIYYSLVARPGNYLEYYIGYLEILSLKELAQDLLGDQFTLKKFHTFLLDFGDAPFWVIREHMESELKAEP